jgi:hypothetical protein
MRATHLSGGRLSQNSPPTYVGGSPSQKSLNFGSGKYNLWPEHSSIGPLALFIEGAPLNLLPCRAQLRGVEWNYFLMGVNLPTCMGLRHGKKLLGATLVMS